MKKRIISVTPLISILLFLVAGLYLDNWGLGWTFFLLIPLSFILLNRNPLKKLPEMMPLIALVVFLWLGLGLSLWHPGWLVFLLIPLTDMIIEKKVSARKMVAILITGAYVAIGLLTDKWSPTWIMFLLIPIINTIFFPQKHSFVTFNGNDLKSKFRNIIIEHEKKDEEE
ncbi:MAG: hypothetical protein JW870_05440 [Candidatus Delongbacteria bacterium]|nr:hypothetical protein [Candidatus Delongbacteria bacterium]